MSHEAKIGICQFFWLLFGHFLGAKRAFCPTKREMPLGLRVCKVHADFVPELVPFRGTKTPIIDKILKAIRKNPVPLVPDFA